MIVVVDIDMDDIDQSHLLPFRNVLEAADSAQPYYYSILCLFLQVLL